MSPVRFELATFRSGVAVILISILENLLGERERLTTRYRCATGPVRLIMFVILYFGFGSLSAFYPANDNFTPSS